MKSFRVGDIVRRKHDRSGRTRRVNLVTPDGDGKQIVVLNQPIDGWGAWSSDQLCPARPTNPARTGPARSTHKRRK